ncbi:two-component regulator propeller domain-containing protein [Parabacteroides gordonii]|uniref:hybrid sensor histidine kinase/response regulator transcription factor n=1 Tax=Parabacteroides gordonii TaxID=574930 RepID=UPI0026F0BA97|nr:two-component regulator propeller domain-containing protein [Parabacteroides gordonii]
MKNTSRFWLFNILMMSVLLWGIQDRLLADNASIKNLRFNRISSFENLPSEEITQIIQDNKGYIWIATNSGLCRYDGYRIRTYKDNLFTPGILTDNQIKTIAEDHSYNLWIGTNNGLNILNMITGQIRKAEDSRLQNKVVSVLYVSKDNNVWVGMDDGLYRYIPERGSFIVYDKATNGRPLVGIKSIMEDSKGRLWIGTWAVGLLRYEKDKDAFISYPQMDDRNSAHVLFEDSYQTIWVGTWDRGLYHLNTPETPETVTWKHYLSQPGNKQSLSDNIIYSIEEETGSNTLWIGTRSGLSILDLDSQSDSFVNYLPESETYKLPYNELDAIVRDRSGIMWLGMMGGGVYSVNMRHSPFQKNNLESVKHRLFSNSVRSMFVDSEQTLWMGIGSYGLVIQEQGAEQPVFYIDHPDFRQPMPYLYTINHIIERRDEQEIWFGTWGSGITIYDKDAAGNKIRHLNEENTPWLPDGFVFSMLEDSHKNIWIGCRSGVAVYGPDGKGVSLSDYRTEPDGVPINYCYYAIEETRDGNIWLGSNHGIIRVSGDASQPDQLQFSLYDRANGKLTYEWLQCLYEDSKGNLWAGSDGGGLNLYDKESDSFISVNRRYNLQTDVVSNIQEDESGNLWLGTGSGLVRLTVSPDAATASSRTYTATDGLPDNSFIRDAIAKAKDGKLYFGGHNGYASFYPQKVKEDDVVPPVAITNISIFNTPLDELTPADREEITPNSSSFANELVLDYNRNHFSIEFSSLSYANPSKNKYAYKLEGYDMDWQYTGASSRVANYNNLKSGLYTFHLKGSNENGLWNEQERVLQIRILPPPWKTTWAYTLYILLLSATVFVTYRILKNRIREKQTQELQKMELVKTKEINHAKLQFFTNITHEFLTPLTILSASLDEMKMQAPQLDDFYKVMSDNINRLIRLLQQILEFRKAETGNLKLKVSEADLATFVRKEVEAFRPLMKKKKMQFSFTCQPDTIVGYFDPDKLDKILYNLLSNASKYNREGGTIDVNLSLDEEENIVTLSVKDNGQGISKEGMKNLFKRFYEGDYRRFNTTGTGIGLSLVKDLITLHEGTIRVESEEGQGATFIVTLPISRSAYKEEQVDEPITPTADDQALPAESGDTGSASKEKSGYSLLLVEDNEELLALMVKLLGREYPVYTAHNGKEAIQAIESNDIDLIVSDVMMPEMNGVELCRYVKGNFDICHIPIILLTAKNKEEDRIEAYESGADGFLSKPFNLSLLHARIKNLLRGKERTARDFKKQLVFEAQELNYTSLDEDFLQRAISCVQKHLDNSEFDQQQFMEEMATSKSTLYKKLKSLTGLNTSAFIRNIRLKAACQIIEEKKRVRISELAYAVGFNDPKYFSACFRKEFGMLPSEYMERYHPEAAEEGEL